MLSNSRFNPAPGLADFWREIRRPNPYRWPILGLSLLPVTGILAWAMEQQYFGEPERPKIEYITTLAPERSDAEIMAENRANQEIKDLKAAEEERIAKAKREMYKSLGAATGLDVEAMEAKAEAEKAAAEAEKAKRRVELQGQTGPGGNQETGQ